MRVCFKSVEDWRLSKVFLFKLFLLLGGVLKLQLILYDVEVKFNYLSAHLVKHSAFNLILTTILFIANCLVFATTIMHR